MLRAKRKRALRELVTFPLFVVAVGTGLFVLDHANPPPQPILFDNQALLPLSASHQFCFTPLVCQPEGWSLTEWAEFLAKLVTGNWGTAALGSRIPSAPLPVGPSVLGRVGVTAELSVLAMAILYSLLGLGASGSWAAVGGIRSPAGPRVSSTLMGAVSAPLLLVTLVGAMFATNVATGAYCGVGGTGIGVPWGIFPLQPCEPSPPGWVVHGDGDSWTTLPTHVPTLDALLAHDFLLAGVSMVRLALPAALLAALSWAPAYRRVQNHLDRLATAAVARGMLGRGCDVTRVRASLSHTVLRLARMEAIAIGLPGIVGLSVAFEWAFGLPGVGYFLTSYLQSPPELTKAILLPSLFVLCLFTYGLRAGLNVVSARLLELEI